MDTFLGIDGGGTKTKFCLADSCGRLLAVSIQPTCHYLQCGFDGLRRILAAGVSEICARAGIRTGDIIQAFAGCPGFGEVSGDSGALQAAVSAALTGIPVRIGNDAENALAGALGGEAGINLVAGTGSIGFGKDESGTSMRCGGWHHAIGSDEGSGYWIGLRLLTAFTRQSDGREPRTQLYSEIRRALELQDDFDVISVVVEQWQLDRTRISALSRLAASLYDNGDPCAVRILSGAADELGCIAGTLYRGLRFSGKIPVSYTGGVFQMGERILRPLRSVLSPLHMELIPPMLPPEQGALILAMQAAGAHTCVRALLSSATQPPH